MRCFYFYADKIIPLQPALSSAGESQQERIERLNREIAEKAAASGVYFAKISAGKFHQTRKMVYLR